MKEVSITSVDARAMRRNAESLFSDKYKKLRRGMK